jgi:hypothetical protein
MDDTKRLDGQTYEAMAEESACEIVDRESVYEVVGLEVRERSKRCLSFAVDAMHVMRETTCGSAQHVARLSSWSSAGSSSFAVYHALQCQQWPTNY